VRILHARLHHDGRPLLDEHPDPDEDRIKHYLAGNLCRCATYPQVI